MAKVQSPLHQHVKRSLEAAFGPPDHTLGRDDHWAIKPLDASRRAPAIHVLVNGTAEVPAIWVFDPFMQGDGVMREGITDEAHLERTIALIRERMAHAVRESQRSTFGEF